jgi:hypothetical protein
MEMMSIEIFGDILTCHMTYLLWVSLDVGESFHHVYPGIVVCESTALSSACPPFPCTW